MEGIRPQNKRVAATYFVMLLLFSDIQAASRHNEQVEHLNVAPAGMLTACRGDSISSDDIMRERRDRHMNNGHWFVCSLVIEVGIVIVSVVNVIHQAQYSIYNLK